MMLSQVMPVMVTNFVAFYISMRGLQCDRKLHSSADWQHEMYCRIPYRRKSAVFVLAKIATG